MTSNEALLEINRIQTQYWGIQETQSDKFKRNARELLDNTATIVHCPNDDCYNGYIISYCDCLNNPKCSRCNGKGVIQERCGLCKGEGWVKMDNEGRLEAIR